jgi:hypothetical protein
MRDGSLDIYASLAEFEGSSGCEESSFLSALDIIIDSQGGRFGYDQSHRMFEQLQSPECVDKTTVLGWLNRLINDVNAWRKRLKIEPLNVMINPQSELTDEMLRVHDILRQCE